MFNFLQFKMHRVAVKQCLGFLLVSTICFATGIRVARADNAANWRKIEEADNKLQSVRLDWRFVRTVESQEQSASQVDYERLKADLTNRGMSAEAVKSQIAAYRSSLKQLAQGVEYKGEMKCLRVDSELRLNLSIFPMQGDGASTEKKHIINYTDGKTGLLIDGMDAKSNSPVPEWGRVITDPGKIMFNVPDSSERLFLFAMPTTALFPSTKTTMTDNGQDTLILETIENPESDFPFSIRATISKTTWRPIKIERFPPHTIQPSKIFEASDFHAYGKGVWLPTRVDYKAPNIHDTISYTLQKAIIGEKIAYQEMKITYGPSIQDCRFGDCISYKLISGEIPDEEKVNELRSGNTDLEPQDPADIPMLAPPVFAMLAPPVSAMFLIGLGVLMLGIETRKSKKRSK